MNETFSSTVGTAADHAGPESGARTHTVTRDVLGPWSLATSRAFWEGFTPAALRARAGDPVLRTVFRSEADWSAVSAAVEQDGAVARITVSGDGDLEVASAQVARFLSLDVDATGWPGVGERDPVIGAVQRELPGLRPCGFHSPYEAAAWCVLSQRLRIPLAAALRTRITERHGDGGAFPAPARLRTLELDLPGRKTEYLHAVADAALEGVLDGHDLRGLTAESAVDRVRQVKGLGPFAAELVVLRGANHPDGFPRHEGRLDQVITERYGADADRETLAEVWRPFRTWASVHLRASHGAG
ncbi:DNA-3-methyladenine glycosylase family protein [Actinoplanes sp. NPDC020271]|uniref:DNA-3-methyladenine glycosylase family protein n=1 Tax=Actinoplanes sp. NPDC020271 TaxID=3363896 RepID=UPI00378B6665